MVKHPIVRNLVVFVVGTIVYALLYAENGLWAAASRWLGPVAMLGWVAILPALFGFALQKSLGERLGTPIHAVVAAPAAVHAALLLWEQLQPFAPPIRNRAVILVLIIGQVLFVYLGALLGSVRPAPAAASREPPTRAGRRRDRPRTPPRRR